MHEHYRPNVAVIKTVLIYYIFTLPVQIWMMLKIRYRLREIRVSENNFPSFSCAFDIRMKMPCWHILCVSEEYRPEECEFRQFTVHQYLLNRQDYDEMSKLFRKIEEQEHLR